MRLPASKSLTRFGRAVGAGIRAAISAYGYDATQSRNKRKAPDGILQSEDAELTPDQRRKLVASGRDIVRNFALAGWMIRKHLDYVSTFSFQSKSGNKSLDRRVEEFMTWWGKRRNCDVAGRHSLARMIRLAEKGRTQDGDDFCIKLADGRLQWIEGDRIRTPYGGFPQGVLPAGVNASDFIHGVRTDPAGAPLQYSLCRRGKTSDFSSQAGQFIFERILSASNVLHHAYIDRFDQVRGVSPLAPAINTLRDCYEGCDYALAKMKVSQLFGLVVKRETADPLGAQSTDDEGKVKLDFGHGPVVLDIAPNEDAKFLESTSPSVEFQQFAQTMIGVALKGLDIPYSFYAENFTNFSGQRQAWIQYDLSARNKRIDNIELLDDLTAWRLKIEIEDGNLPMFDVESLPWRFLPQGVPWIDPLKEVQADVQAIAAGLGSRTRFLREQGEDFEEIAQELADENELLKSLGLPTDVKPSNAQIVEIAANAA